MTTKTKPCPGCSIEIPTCVNRCWDCGIANAIEAGGKFYCPNELPVGCIKADGNMFEHEHGDHPDYKFPVSVEYVGPLKIGHVSDYATMISSDVEEQNLTLETFDEAEVRATLGEVHALVYTDGIVALTLYEHTYALWLLEDGGKPICDQRYWKKLEWRLSETSVEKIRALKR